MHPQDEASIERLLEEISKVIVGQEHLIEGLIIGLFCAGHILIEGVPGLAKTTAVKTLASAIDVEFNRIQFTPDLLPADLIGTMIYNPADRSFHPRKGPIFTNLLLADEINRAPAKVQSALLEAMQERQVTIGDITFPLQEPFMVLATQNPIEQEGTYPLPEAQIDRFMLKLKLDYPSREEELKIMRRMSKGEEFKVEPVIGAPDILRMRDEVRKIYIDSRLEEYIVDIVRATRSPSQFGLADLEPLIEYGASPRASIYLSMTSKAHAFLQGRDFVLPEDVQAMAMDVLRHRIILSYEAEAEEITSEWIITRILETIELP
ncbi:TPA: MoxR family ATPase [Candidatus Poribacteria bacterium]|nr:MoxR family ATPase [Candidatus Poribacteria bacterium]HEX29989.1 MoxR family ATPase [Candidatus Poribacteria bacterium]